MDSNKKFMMLSLLNLYLAYLDTKSENKEQKKPRIGSGYDKIYSKLAASRNDNTYKVNPKPISEIKKENTNPPIPDAARTIQNEQDNAINSITSSTIHQQPTTSGIKVVKRVRNGKKKKISDPNRKKNVRRWAIRPMNRDWALTGFQRKVFANVKNMDQEQFFAHTRMSKPLFDWLLSFTQSSLNKKRQRIDAEERLVITLNFLAYGTSMQSIAFKHKVGRSTIREIILNTCEVLWNLLAPVYCVEIAASQYADIANDFKSNFDMPNCVGAIDGKILPIKIPAKKKYVNDERACKHLLLMGVCDTKYKFTSISAEIYNNEKDETIFQLCPNINAIVCDELTLPSAKPLFPSSSPFPHYFITNTMLPLRKNLMRPYESTYLDKTKAIFNYKMSRAQSVTDNAFGILLARWRVLCTTLEFLPHNLKNIVLSCVALHNYIMSNDEDHLYCPDNFVDHEGEDGNIISGEWRNELEKNGDQPLQSVETNMPRATYGANSNRETLANYLANEAISYEIEVI